MIAQLSTDVLVVGGGTGGTAAAIQAARRGVQTILVSEFAWLGGMLTAAGVCAPDGNELAAFQTGLWGAYLQALRHRQTGGLDNSWVSLFAYDPRTGAKIFADWVKQLPNLHWISGQTPLEVIRRGDRIIGVRFADYIIKAKITIDGTELGDLLALAEVPHRWGWELQSEFNEPSAPTCFNELTNKYPVQASTWVFILKDYGESPSLPLFPSPHFSLSPSSFQGAWSNYGGEKFLNYGRLPGGLFMINWPICGNDYGEGIGRLIESETSRQEFLQQAYWYSYNFAHFIQTELGQRYSLAPNIFPQKSLHHAFALHPYYRESRRIRGQVTIAERDILPVNGGCVAALPRTENGEVSAIAIGNYANDHHYPGINFPLQPKSIRWGGRWTGTPFTIPYGSLVPNATEGLLVCEKNISVSHIANGCTRLQPVVMNIGQAAGMAAALCIELNCQPQEIPIRSLQEALLTDSIAPSAVIPLFDLPPEHGDWLYWQKYYLDHPEDYPLDGNCHCQEIVFEAQNCSYFTGVFHARQHQQYNITLTEPTQQGKKTWSLITTRPEVNLQLQNCRNGQLVSLLGQCNFSGGWLVVEKIRISLT
ncbi:glucose-inhibited division protein A [Hydrococcus rivularis NIES-593]|uniref:Glucose-inhibited division protein A n=1 Tax=Hydrococcus rivularis NIES-593 TaxID=1921803 RepID=A0A1U7HNW2_9CYAN|nr:FAD-dependent oxidoreductase [Hydrococcus rivularis]OKH25276.1 glucose-inhibited division protein A [Hydrococcus rivularis NIES-593]